MYKRQRQFKEEPYPEYGEVFVAHCKVCDSDQNHTRVLTRKTQAELRRRQEEEDLKKSISDQCARHGFTCRFLYQSVIITTPLADWCFDYHEKYKTLYHENTPNTKYLTGHYVKAHTQFNGKKMTVSADVYKRQAVGHILSLIASFSTPSAAEDRERQAQAMALPETTAEK